MNPDTETAHTTEEVTQRVFAWLAKIPQTGLLEDIEDRELGEDRFNSFGNQQDTPPRIPPKNPARYTKRAPPALLKNAERSKEASCQTSGGQRTMSRAPTQKTKEKRKTKKKAFVN